MKIRNEHIQALQEMDARKKQPVGAEGFEALLSEALAQENAGTASAISGDKPIAIKDSALLALDMARPLTSTQRTQMAANFTEATARMDAVLSNLDTYASYLATGDASHLKKAYSFLENMTGTIANLRSEYPDMAETNPELAAILTELDILATTEQIKFNRGDYL